MSTTVKHRANLGVESLEARDLMSWTTPPTLLPAGGDRFTINHTANNGSYSYTSRITRGEVDSYRFTAQRTGNYVFEANAASSAIDTVMALYDVNGRRLAYDDDSGPGSNSKMTVRLTAGRTYTIGISNYRDSSNGAYNVKFTPPNLSAYASTDLGRIYSSGSATLNGTTLTISLTGQTLTNFDRTLHYINVRILKRDGTAIHTGGFYRSFSTAGTYIPGTPSRDSDSWSFNLSGWNLSSASRLDVSVGYRTY